MRTRPGWRAAWRPTALAAAGIALAASVAVGTRQPRSAAPDATSLAAPDAPTRVLMRNVDFYVDPQVVLHIHDLRGTMRSLRGGPVLFDDKRSFLIHIDAAEVGLTGPDLSALMNKYVFAYRGAPLANLRITVANGQLVQRGVLRKGVSLPFEMTATPTAMPDGRIRLHPTRTKILGVNGEKLMKAFGLSLEKLIDLRRARGASVRGNDLYLDPVALLPPPAIEGRVTAVRISGQELVQTFGPDSAAAPSVRPPDPAAPSYMFYRGGTLRFGKLLMLDAEMQIVDLDGKPPFKFDLDRYQAQLVAGYSRTLANQGLEVYMRDVDQLNAPRPAAPVVAPPSGESPP